MNRTLFVLSLLGLVTLFSCSRVKGVAQQSSSMGEYHWTKVDSLEQQGLYRSAWDEAESIFKTAKVNGDYQSQYKALCYQLKYANRVEEGSELDAIKRLETIAEESDMPLKAIAHSMAGEAYWAYFQQHQWQIMQRTDNAQAEDIRFWDLRQFVDACDLHFAASLSQPERLKLIRISDLDAELIQQKENEELRPSLYEMLAYRAIGFYTDQTSSLGRPKTFFQVDNPKYYSPADEFSQLALPKEDTLSFAYRALSVYQQILTMQEAGSEAYLSSDLERLRFVSRKSSIADKEGEVKDRYFLVALRQVIANNEGSEARALFQVEEATLFSQAATAYQYGADEAHKEDYNIAEALSKQVLASFPDGRAGQLARNMLLDIEQRNMQIQVEQVNLPQQAALCKVEYRNIDKGYFRLVSVPRDFEPNGRRDYEQTIRALLRFPEVASWEIDLPESADHQAHNTETILPAIDNGRYALIMSSEAEFKNKAGKTYAYFWASNIGIMQGPSPAGGVEISLLHRESGEPLANADVIHYSYSYDRKFRKQVRKEIGRYTSDQEGQISIPHLPNNYSQSIDVDWNGDFFTTGIYNRNPLGEEGNYQSVQLFTDRSIYRPGQTVHFKGIVLDINDGEPIIRAGQTMELILRDANYQEVSKLQVTSNDFGSFSGTFTLPSSGLTGQMTIQSPYGGVSISVEEYKRPKFQVAMNPIEGEFALGDMVTTTGEAMGYNGAPITDAEVRYVVTRAPVMRWYYWSWWYRPPAFDTAPVQVAVGQTETDDEGKFSLDFEAITGRVSGGEDISYYTYKIAVEVTDINGETREGSASVNIGKESLILSSSLPADIDIKNLPQVNISAENLNGEPVPMSGQWELRHIPIEKVAKKDRLWSFPQFQSTSKAQFDDALPLFYHSQPTTELADEGELIVSGEWNTAISESWDADILKDQSPGTYIFKLTAQDGATPSTWSTRCTLYDSESASLAYDEALKVVDIGAPYLPGEEARILLSSHWSEMPVRLRLEHDRKVVWEKEVELNRGQKLVGFPIETGYQEGVHLHVEAIRHDRSYVQTVAIEVTPIDHLLDVSLETYRDKMQPGSAEEWRLKVKAQNGDKVISELLLGC